MVPGREPVAGCAWRNEPYMLSACIVGLLEQAKCRNVISSFPGNVNFTNSLFDVTAMGQVLHGVGAELMDAFTNDGGESTMGGSVSAERLIQVRGSLADVAFEG
ncbi:MAG TPA: hypothetical protein VLG36_03755 [Candidatus Chromulinivoraceae bacterium]|nr:hypothetical protein [Candidatus Chromulinivoraceae bacterium]